MLSLNTLLEQFLQKLDNHKHIWWRLAIRVSRPQRQFGNNPYYITPPYKNLYYSNPNYYKSQSHFNNYSASQAGQDVYQLPLKKNPFRQPQDKTDPAQENIKQLNGPKPKLMITFGPANGSNLLSKQTSRNNALYLSNFFGLNGDS